MYKNGDIEVPAMLIRPDDTKDALQRASYFIKQHLKAFEKTR
jgi:hypothetical protein